MKAPCDLEAAGLPVDMYECRIADGYMAMLDVVSRYLRFYCAQHSDGISCSEVMGR